VKPELSSKNVGHKREANIARVTANKQSIQYKININHHKHQEVSIAKDLSSAGPLQP
jgi:predicted transport protein